MTMIQTEGTYTAKVTDAMLTTSASSNSPQINIVLEVTDTGEEHGHAMTYYGSFSGGGLKYTVDALVKALGYSGNGADLWAFVNEVRGRECKIVVAVDDYNGKLKIKWLNPLRAGASDDEQQKLAAMLAGAIDQYTGGKGKQSKGTVADLDDDLKL